ncbi:MAG: DsbA family protein [Halarcobacter sp.]
MIHTLYYVYDPMCSWCYAFRDTFKEVKKNLDSNIEIVYVPGGLASHNKEPMEEALRIQIQGAWKKIEEVVGTKFNYNFWTKCTPKRSTYLACQATLAAKKQEKEEEIIEAIQNAYYLNAKNPSDEETIFEVAKELDLDFKKFKNDLYSEETIQEFYEKMNLRKKLHLNSFPSLAIKYKKEIYPINIKYNNPQAILEQIKDLTTNVYF